MSTQVIEFYSALRQIFGVCDCCGEVFRVSDCKLYQKNKPANDWKEKIDSEIDRLDRLEEKLEEKIEKAREAAREAGRKEADKLVKKIDPIFSPLRLNPNDAKVIFHPVDFIVFDGMNNNKGEAVIKNISLLDKSLRTGEDKTLQTSIETAVQEENYEWLTLRVEENGEITEE